MILAWDGWIKSFSKSFILPNLPIIVALFILSTSPIFLLHNNYDVPNQNAGYAFYLLIAGIIWKIIRYTYKIFPSKDKIPNSSSETKK